MLYKIRSIAYCTCILKGGLGTLNSWVLCHFLKAKSQSILWFRILSFVYISSLERLRYNSKKRVPRIKMIATPLVFSFILIIKCVSGSKKLLTIFGGSESKQKQNSKLVGPHQSFILHLKSKNGMSYGIYLIYALFLWVITSETHLLFKVMRNWRVCHPFEFEENPPHLWFKNAKNLTAQLSVTFYGWTGSLRWMLIKLKL